MTAKVNAPGAPSPRLRQWLAYGTAAAMLAWYFVSSVSTVANKCTTFDERDHLTAGYCSWKFADFRMESGGNLAQRWAAIPLLFSNTHFPDRDQTIWRLSSLGDVGEQFFYGVGNNADAMLLRARSMTALFGVALGALVFFWTRSLLGAGPALMSLGLYAFCPTMLANGPLVTADMAAAFFFNASILCLWRVLHRVNWHILLIGSLMMGGLFVSKYSAILMVPMALILVATQLISRTSMLVTLGTKTWEVQRRSGRLAIHAATFALSAVVVWVVIWSFYNFRYEMFATKALQPNSAGEMVATDSPLIPWEKLLGESTTVQRFIGRLRDGRLLPEAYLWGFANMWRSAQYRSGFLNGKYSYTGWPQFFPYCLLVKTPLTLFVLLALAAVWIYKGWCAAGDDSLARSDAIRASLYRAAPLLTLFFVYFASAISSHLNIGHRHIIPTYPAMLMLAGNSWFWLARRQLVSGTSQDSPGRRHNARRSAAQFLFARRWPLAANLVLVSIGLFAAESLSRWPNYLAYFNQLAGGPSTAYRHLVDSSLEWGQELPALKRWLEEQGLNDAPSAKVYLSYFGTGNPLYYGISATLLPCYLPRIAPHVSEPLEAGTYCISATMLQDVYSTFPGRWNRQYEARYQELASNVRMFEVSTRIGREQLLADRGAAFWTKVFRLYEDARLGRITSFLRQREPDTQINYSIFVYRLTTSDLNRMLEGLPAELEEEPTAL